MPGFKTIKRLIPEKGILLCLFTILASTLQAQKDTLKSFEITGQLMHRAEFRNGYGKLMGHGQDPAFFVGQRARVNLAYTFKDIRFFFSAHDIRVWGNTSNTKVSDNLLSVYEAFLDAGINNSWRIKLGRQELNYDNVRFLGNLDWAFQGRSHDAVLIKHWKNDLKLDAGAAYNQDGISLSHQPYTVPDHYKIAQFFHLENKWKALDWSVLIWNQGLEQQVKNNQGMITHWRIRYSQTIGVPVLRYRVRDFSFFGFYYHQLGQDAVNRPISAFDASLQTSWKRTLKNKEGHFQATLGAEYLSGNDYNPTNNTRRAFNPLYGTNHAHNGYMDYFFSAGRNNNGLGLFDRFLRLKYQPDSKNFCSLNTHSFAITGEWDDNNGKPVNKDLGIELDLTLGHVFNEALSVQLGYSQLFASGTMKRIQNLDNASDTQNWAYVMLLFRPHSKNKFVGLIF